MVDIGVECKVANDDRIEFLTEFLNVVLEVWVTAVDDAGLRCSEEVLHGNVERIDDEERVREKVDDAHVLIDALDLIMMRGSPELIRGIVNNEETFS